MVIASTPGHPVYARLPAGTRGRHLPSERHTVHDHRTGRIARLYDATGLVGYLALGIALILGAVAITAWAGDGSHAAWWGLATGIAVLVAWTFLLISWELQLYHAPGDTTDRASSYPLQPEVSAEEALRYEQRYHPENHR